MLCRKVATPHKRLASELSQSIEEDYDFLFSSRNYFNAFILMKSVQKKTHNMSLRTQAGECLRMMLLKWQPSTDNFVDIMLVSNYLQQFTTKLRYKLFNYLLVHPHYCDAETLYTVQAGHVAALIIDSPEQLLLKFENRIFEFQLLLDICGCKLKDIEWLQLPYYSKLSDDICARMCRLLPNLNKLILFAVDVSDGAMTYLTAFHLELLDLSSTTISDEGINNLCFGKPNIKRTLRILNIEDTNVSIFGCAEILKYMPLIEDLGVYSSWLTALPVGMMNLVFNIQKLSFNTSCDKVEDALEIAVNTCSNVSAIDITINRFSARIVRLLAQFQRLTTLNINDCAFLLCDLKSIKWWHHDKNSDLANCITQTTFPSLKELSLRDVDNVWFKTGRFNSDGFDDDIAAELTNTDSELEQLCIINCNELRPVGVNELMNIKSLTDCTIHFKKALRYSS
uniref:Uncharacterized protein n=1 Tax=Strigamia maritima TaxID=126957 RepID=T1IPQ0_STRMM